MLTYNIQLAHFDSDQVEDRGSIDRKGALDALTSFPFHEELAKLSEREEGCLPTIAFRDSSDNSLFAVWIDESNKFTFECELGKHSLSMQRKFDSLDILVQALGHFVDKNWEGITTEVGFTGSSFFLFGPKFRFLLIFETIFILIAAITNTNRASAARIFIEHPTDTELFVYQLIAINVIAALVMVALVKFNPQKPPPNRSLN